MQKRRGFTLVELLIVIVVIAILAAITIVAYTNVTKRAGASVIQNDLQEAAQWFETYYAQTGSYPTTLAVAEDPAQTNNSPLKLSTPNSQLAYSLDTSVSPAVWSLTATSADGSQNYYVSRTSSNPSAGITNLVINPLGTGVTMPTSTTYNISGSWKSQWWGGTSGAGNFSNSGGIVTKTWTTSPTASQNWDSWYGPLVPVTAGAVISASITDNISAAPGGIPTGSGGLEGQITFLDNTGTAVGSAAVGPVKNWSSITIGTPFTLTIANALVPSGAVLAYLHTYMTSNPSPFPAVGMILQVSKPIVTLGPLIPNYADGTTANWAWNGGAASSTSSGPAS